MSVSRLRSAASGFLFVLLLAGASAPTRAEDAWQILASSLEPLVTTYTGEQVSEVSTRDGAARRIHRQQVFRRGNVLRINYSTGQVAYDDGREALLYLPRQNLLEVGPSRLAPERVRQQRRAIENKKVSVELLGEDTVADRPAYVLLVRLPTGASRKVWIDRETRLQLRLDETGANGRTVSTYFTSISFTAPPPAQLAFTPPPGAVRVERGHGRPIPAQRAAALARAWGGLLTPKVVPPGFEFRGFYQHRFQGRPVLVAVYTREGDRLTLSMFQGPAAGMDGMVERRPGRLRVLSERKGQADVTLVAPLPEAELQKVMDSIAPQP